MHAVRRIAAFVPLLLVGTVASAEEPKAPESKEAKPPVATTESSAGASASASTTAISYSTADGKTLKCKEQSAQPFLVRGNWFPKSNDPDKVKAARKLLEDAI